MLGPGLPGGGGDALVANALSQFAVTTSLQLAGILSNETGTGSLVFSTTPTLEAPKVTSIQGLSTGGAAVTGNATLASGTVTVTTSAAVTASQILLTRKTSGGTIGTALTYTINSGVSFTITSDNVLDTSVISWFIVGSY